MEFRASSRNNADGGAWNRNGEIVFAPGLGAPLMWVSAAGGKATPATTLDTAAGDTKHVWPQFLPGGNQVLYFAANKDQEKSAVFVQQLGSPQRVEVMRNLTRAAWAPPGYLVFARPAQRRRVRRDLARRAISFCVRGTHLGCRGAALQTHSVDKRG